MRPSDGPSRALSIDPATKAAFETWLNVWRSFDPTDLADASAVLSVCPHIEVAALFSGQVAETLKLLRAAEPGIKERNPDDWQAVLFWSYKEAAETAASFRAYDAASAICAQNVALNADLPVPTNATEHSLWFDLRVLTATIETKRGNFQAALDLLESTTAQTKTQQLRLGNQQVLTLLDIGSTQRATAAFQRTQSIKSETEDSPGWVAAKDDRLLIQGRLYLAQERPDRLRKLVAEHEGSTSPVAYELRALNVQGSIEAVYSDPSAAPPLIELVHKLRKQVPHQSTELLIALYELQTIAEAEDEAGETSDQLGTWILNSPGAFASRTEEIYLSVSARRMIAASRYSEFRKDAESLLASMEQCFEGVLDRWRGADATDSGAGFVKYRSHRMLLGSMIRLADELDKNTSGTRTLEWLLKLQHSSGAVRNAVDRGIDISAGGTTEVQAALARLPSAGLVCIFGSNLDSWALIVTPTTAVVRELPSYNKVGPAFRELADRLASLGNSPSADAVATIEARADELSELVLAPMAEDIAPLRNVAWIDVGLLAGFPATGLSAGPIGAFRAEGSTLGERIGVWTPPPLPIWLHRQKNENEQARQFATTRFQVGVAGLELAPGASAQTTDQAVARLAGDTRDVTRLDEPQAIALWLENCDSEEATLIAHGEFDHRTGSTAIQLPDGQFDVETAFALANAEALPTTLLLSVCGGGLHHEAVGEPIAASSLGGALVSSGIDQVIQSRNPLTLNTAILLANQWAGTNRSRSPAQRLAAVRRYLVEERGWIPLHAAMIELHGVNSSTR